MPDLRRYWHTVRYLRPIQLYGRVAFRAIRPRPDTRPAPALRERGRGRWVAPARRVASLVGPTRLRFLNEVHDLADIGWDDSALAKLWRYNLHYFDDLNAVGAAERAAWHRALLERWVHDNPPALGSGWEPYPTSLRIVNWIKWAMAGNVLPPAAVESLAVQLRWLTRRLERHLLGNHLFVNAKALVFGGAFFAGDEAREWMETGLRILAREIPEQILADGGQFELSPMYHALALEDAADLCNVAAAFPDSISARWAPAVAQWPSQLASMRRWLATMVHPDGEIGFFNDAAMGVAPTPQELEEYADRLGAAAPLVRRAVTHLAESGYVRVERDGAVALLDVGRVGPEYLPAHAHADTLSFELSLFGHRVLVNSGTSRYGAGAERLRERATPAHNTVTVDGESSSEVWGGFRVARRARPLGLAIAEGDGVRVRCAHDGYRRLAGRVDHVRRWSFGAGTLVVEDTLTGRFTHAEARYHLHPSVQLEATADQLSRGELRLALPGGQRVRVSIAGGALRHEPTTWHAEFGRTEPTVCIVVEFRAAAVRTSFAWQEHA